MKTLMTQPASDISARLTMKRLAAVAVVLGCLACVSRVSEENTEQAPSLEINVGMERTLVENRLAAAEAGWTYYSAEEIRPPHPREPVPPGGRIHGSKGLPGGFWLSRPYLRFEIDFGEDGRVTSVFEEVRRQK